MGRCRQTGTDQWACTGGLGIHETPVFAKHASNVAVANSAEKRNFYPAATPRRGYKLLTSTPSPVLVPGKHGLRCKQFGRWQIRSKTKNVPGLTNSQPHSIDDFRGDRFARILIELARSSRETPVRSTGARQRSTPSG